MVAPSPPAYTSSHRLSFPLRGERGQLLSLPEKNAHSPDFTLMVDFPSKTPVRDQIDQEKTYLMKKFRVDSLENYWQSRFPECAELLKKSNISLDEALKNVAPKEKKKPHAAKPRAASKK